MDGEVFAMTKSVLLATKQIAVTATKSSAVIARSTAALRGNLPLGRTEVMAENGFATVDRFAGPTMTIPGLAWFEAGCSGLLYSVRNDEARLVSYKTDSIRRDQILRRHCEERGSATRQSTFGTCGSDGLCLEYPF